MLFRCCGRVERFVALHQGKVHCVAPRKGLLFCTKGRFVALHQGKVYCVAPRKGLLFCTKKRFVALHQEKLKPQNVPRSSVFQVLTRESPFFKSIKNVALDVVSMLRQDGAQDIAKISRSATKAY